MKLALVSAALALSPLVASWQFNVFENDDQICSTTPMLTIQDAAPGGCIPLDGTVTSVEWLPYVGKGPLTGTNEIDFYPSMDECNEDINLSLLRGIYNLDDEQCINAEAPTRIIKAYKIWKR